jgi:ribonuclease D
MTTTSTAPVIQGDLTKELFDRFVAAERVAWDIETSGLEWKDGEIGTCQLHAPEVGTVIVQGPHQRPSYLMQLLASSDVAKVFHHAPFDLRWMVGHWGAAPATIECTKVASRLLDSSEDSSVHSLKHLLKINLGVDIDKGERISNWLSANLTPAQLAYAAGDVEFLLPLLDSLHKQLANHGLVDLYRRCAEFLPTRVELEVGAWPDVFGY